jgi:hypothetical protein
MGLACESGGYPSPRFFGISDLAESSKLIYGAQSLTGKILMSKNLGAGALERGSKLEQMRGSLRPVSASTMMAQASCGPQGQMSHGAVEKRWYRATEPGDCLE